MIHSRGVNSTPSKNTCACLTLMLGELVDVLRSDGDGQRFGPSLAPLHFGHGTWLMNSSIFSRRYSESVSA